MQGDDFEACVLLNSNLICFHNSHADYGFDAAERNQGLSCRQWQCREKQYDQALVQVSLPLLQPAGVKLSHE